MDLFDLHNPLDIRVVAFHEAGHAVATIVVGLPLVYVKIWMQTHPDGSVQWRGRTLSTFTDDDIAGKGENAVPYLVQGFSGLFAEQMVNRLYHAYNGGSGDAERLRHLANLAVCGDAHRWQAILESAARESQRIVNDFWPAIEKVAALLQESQELDGNEVVAIVKAT